MNNIILMTDSYKLSHYRQYPPQTQKVYSYFESRHGAFPYTIFFGLQYFIKKYLTGVVVTKEKIDEAEALVAAHLGDKGLFNRTGWEHILEKHGGKLPVIIKAVPEGTKVSTRNVLMTIENTDPECFWLTNYLETLLVQVWYPTTVATLSHICKATIADYLEKTGTPSLIGFKLHDFGFRGVSSVESAGIGGAAHLVNFMGTDTIEALVTARDFYGEPMAGFSIPAAEHSTITSWGKDHEAEAMENMLDQFPTGLVAVVSDSFDIFNACEKIWGEELRHRIITRDGTLVVRPDSGDPKTVLLKVLNILGEKLGMEENAKGYKVLNEHIRVIQGDGVNRDSIREILEHLKLNGWSADNLAFGMGGALLQQLNRDTLNFAFKASAVQICGTWHEVFKDPVTQSMKKSKAGRMVLVRDPMLGVDRTVVEADSDWFESKTKDRLVEVFKDGELLVDQKFSEIRARAQS